MHAVPSLISGPQHSLPLTSDFIFPQICGCICGMFCACCESDGQDYGISSKVVERMAVKCTYKIGRGMNETCSICLEDFTEGEKVRELPCLHGELCVCVCVCACVRACVRACVDILLIHQFIWSKFHPCSVPWRMCGEMAEGVQAHMSPL